jgi:hypothetical protein
MKISNTELESMEFDIEKSLLRIAFFFIGLIDLAHILAYKGMPIFYGFDSELPIQLWILARYIQVLSLLIGCLLIKKYITFIIYAAIVPVAFWMIFFESISTVFY